MQRRQPQESGATVYGFAPPRGLPYGIWSRNLIPRARDGERFCWTFSGATSLGSFPIPLVANTGVFFGVAGNAGENITSVLLRSQTLTPGTGGEGYGMDDVAVALVPEPAAATFVAALASLLLARRGRRA